MCLAMRRTWETVVEAMPDVADHCLMRVNIAKSASQPTAVRILVTDPTMQFGIVESLSEAAREALALGGDKI